MTWLLYTLVSPTLNALVNFTDKYLIEKVAKGRGIGALIIISALMGLPTAGIIFIVQPEVFSISISNALLIILNGTFYTLWVLPYLYALEKDEASIVMPLFQLASVASLILAFIILKETLTLAQLSGCVLVLFGGIGLSTERHQGKLKIKAAIIGLVGLSCFFIAVSGVIFKYVALEETFWVTSFWEALGIFLSSIPLLFITSYRKQLFHLLKTSPVKVLALSAGSEIFVMVGRLSLNFATLLAPVSLVYFVDNGFHPFFVLAYGLVLTTLFPKFTNESTDTYSISKKLVFISVMFAGTYILSFL